MRYLQFICLDVMYILSRLSAMKERFFIYVDYSLLSNIKL